eukprot:g6837.t1
MPWLERLELERWERSNTLLALLLAAGVGAGVLYFRTRPKTGKVVPDLNADLNLRVVMRTSGMEWTRSGPSDKVERKRCFRAGPVESGAVTSVVRFLPGASFPDHPHPQGEEIFVLKGTFSDWRGNHGPGTFLLNPEGFSHAPSSAEGNELFVRLRQYPNAPPALRQQKVLATNTMPWTSVSEGVYRKLLHDDRPRFTDLQYLEKWDKDVKVQPSSHPGGLEVFVLEGSFQEQGHADTYSTGDWLRWPAWTKLRATAGPQGCMLLVKTGGLQYAIPGKI